MNVPSRGIHSCRTTSPESCRSILSESVNENRERLKKCHTFQYGLKTSVVLFSMISKNCLLFQLMKQKSVYSNQEKTKSPLHTRFSLYLFFNHQCGIAVQQCSLTKQHCGMTKPRCKFRNRCFSFCLWKYTKRSLVDFICSILHTLKLAYKINYIFRLSTIKIVVIFVP